MFIQKHNIGILSIVVLAFFLLQLSPAIARPSLRPPSNTMTDSEQLAAAKTALENVQTLNPIEGEDANVLPLVQTIIDAVSSGIKVTVYKSSNSQVDRNGAIIYGNSEVKGNVTFKLTKNRTSITQAIMVVVPSQVDSDPDAAEVALAKAALADAGTLTPAEGVDNSVVPMAQVIVDLASSGVAVTISSSDNPQVAEDGTITYGSSEAAGSVTFTLTNNDAVNTQSMSVVVPAKVVTDLDATEVAAAKAALAEAATLKPAEGTDISVVTMADSIVDKVSNGVAVTITSSDNLQVAEDGTITYGSSEVAGNVTFTLAKNDAVDTQSMLVVVPAKVAINVVNVKDYGAKGDGDTDDTIAIQNAAKDAKTKGLTLLVPGGDYLISSNINIYTSVECQGKILIPNSAALPSINIIRTVRAVSISPYTLTGLARGSTELSGLGNYPNGTIVLKSSEELIKRDNGPGQFYTKNDASAINDNDGLYPGLDCTYNDLSKLTVTVFPYEEPIVISGLNIESFGNTSSAQCLVNCERSNVTFDDLVIVNSSTAGSPSCALYTLNCVNITLNNPVISNINPVSGDGYGINIRNTANVVINDGEITECATALTGRHAKDVAINGGYYSKKIDSHWGNNYVIDGATIEERVGYAGTDITIRNCEYVNCSRLLLIRYDTPELMGNVIIDNVTTRYADTTMYGFGYSTGEETMDFGRELKTPDYVSITNVLADIPDVGAFNVYTSSPSLSQCNSLAPMGEIFTNNIRTVGGLGEIILGY